MAKLHASYKAFGAMLSERANQPAKNEAGNYFKSDPYSLPSDSENQPKPTRNSGRHFSIALELPYEVNSKSQDKTS